METNAEKRRKARAADAVRSCGCFELIRAVVNRLDYESRQAGTSDETRAVLKKEIARLVTAGGRLKSLNIY